MRHHPNSTRWQVGDIVIFDGDPKTQEYLMRVVRTDSGGYVWTSYLTKQLTWKNHYAYLHDPKRFGLEIKELDKSE